MFPAYTSYSLHPIKLKFCKCNNMTWSSSYCFEVTVRQISAELCPFENVGNFFVSNQLHLQFTSGALNYAGVSICATSYYLPQAYNASTCRAFVCFLAHLSWRLKVSFCDHSPSVVVVVCTSVRLSVRPSTIFKQHLLLNHWLDFDQTSQEWSLVGPLSKLFKWFRSVA